jgi:hypothetical protein
MAQNVPELRPEHWTSRAYDRDRGEGRDAAPPGWLESARPSWLLVGVGGVLISWAIAFVMSYMSR